MTKIIAVVPGSIAEEGGIQPGDYLVAINGREVNDILEFKFITADEEYELTIQKPDGSYEVLDIVNQEGEDLGLSFENALMTKARCCANRCIFCFIDQLPKGMRETLYFKDDDSRLSFLQGNYVTLTNLSEREIDNMINMHLSPINVSVQATEPELREFMLGNKRAGRLLEQMKKFAQRGIVMNCQIVLCPGINDGDHLDRSLSDLASFFPQVASISIVPVGISKHREGLYPLKPFDKESSQRVVEQVLAWQERFLRQQGKRMVYLADEFYLMAGLPFPPYDDYEDFPQLENGVGMAALTMEEFEEERKRAGKARAKKVTVATGEISAPMIRELTQKIQDVDCQVAAIHNDFFGSLITVSGLVTASDMIRQLKGKDLGEALLIPSNMLRTDTNIFLDDLTTEDVERELNTTVVVTRSGSDFAQKLIR